MNKVPIETFVGREFNEEDYLTFAFTSGVPYPYSLSDPNKYYFNLPKLPEISSMSQFKSDGLTVISEGEQTTENEIVFSATLSEIPTSQFRLEVETQPVGDDFTDSATFIGDLVDGVDVATAKAVGLTDGAYHWQARIVDEDGNSSDWQEFGDIGNTDFILKTVPLYTQVRSSYPSDDDTRVWSSEPYAEGRGNIGADACGETIAECGCAIASAAMILRYYDITSSNSKDVNPLTINEWLNVNNGYISNGNLSWPKIAEYSKMILAIIGLSLMAA